MGLAYEAADGVDQSCIAVSRSGMQDAANRLSGNEPSADLQEVAVLTRDGTISLSGPVKTRIADRAKQSLGAAASSMAASPRVVCPTDGIRQAADLASSSGQQIEIPAPIASCVTRLIRWQGMLPDSISQPSAMPTSLAYLASRMTSPGSSQSRPGVIPEPVDWADKRLSDIDRLILALTFDRSRVTGELVDRVVGEHSATGVLGVLVLSEAAVAMGQCPPAVADLTRTWVRQVSADQGGGGLWSIFAIHAARACISKSETAVLETARGKVSAAISVLPTGRSDQDDLTVTWTWAVARCLGLKAGDGPLTSDQVQAVIPRSMTALLSSRHLSLLDLLTYAQMANYPRLDCKDLGWLAG
jgi:hypothetical protein